MSLTLPSAETQRLIGAAAWDAGNRSSLGPHLHGVGSADAPAWTYRDLLAAAREQNRLMHAVGFRMPNRYAIKFRKLSETRRCIAQSRPVTSRDFVKVR